MIFVPALRFLFSELDRIHGHFRRYHRAELRAQFAEAGFEIETSRYFDVLGVLPWWLLNTLLGATGFNPALAQAYDRAFVPMTRAVEGLAGAPFGKNVLIVGRKKESH